MLRLMLERLAQAIDEDDWNRVLDQLDRMQGECERLQAAELYQLRVQRRPRQAQLSYPSEGGTQG